MSPRRASWLAFITELIISELVPTPSGTRAA